MSTALDAELEAADIIPDAYVLEISSPGISRLLSSDREFITFKGFPVTAKTTEPDSRIKEWKGLLLGRDETAVYLNQKGRQVKIPRPQIVKVELDEGKEM